jgi:hypothetical protein
MLSETITLCLNMIWPVMGLLFRNATISNNATRLALQQGHRAAINEVEVTELLDSMHLPRVG